MTCPRSRFGRGGRPHNCLWTWVCRHSWTALESRLRRGWIRSGCSCPSLPRSLLPCPISCASPKGWSAALDKNSTQLSCSRSYGNCEASEVSKLQLILLLSRRIQCLHFPHHICCTARHWRHDHILACLKPLLTLKCTSMSSTRLYKT